MSSQALVGSSAPKSRYSRIYHIILHYITLYDIIWLNSKHGGLRKRTPDHFDPSCTCNELTRFGGIPTQKPCVSLLEPHLALYELKEPPDFPCKCLSRPLTLRSQLQVDMWVIVPELCNGKSQSKRSNALGYGAWGFGFRGSVLLLLGSACIRAKKLFLQASIAAPTNTCFP